MSTDIQPITLSKGQFDAVSRRIYDACGIKLVTGKEGLVKSRLTRRVRELGLGDFGGYLDFVDADPSGRETAAMVDLLTTNTTHFFRETHHFDFLRETVLPGLPDGGRKLRIWSAGCSTGEEPYTLAMNVCDTFVDAGARDVKILATDISRRAVLRARTGVYAEADEVAKNVPAHFLEKYFDRKGGTYEVKARVRSMVSFARLNLMEPWPMSGPFDAIFCRNVMIYFDKETQRSLARRYMELLRPGGYLFIGHAESLSGFDGLTYVRPAVYAK
jgi:chemotaxis protein methyltransferase CheR